jgi:hypothetical protein
MRSAAAYLPHNPFVDLSVGEAELWGNRAWLDVPQIHVAPFQALKSVIRMVQASRRTQIRFIRGVGGSGKSHLFARLRREMADGILYAYAPNPPLQSDGLEGFVLNKIVSSLRHRARKQDGGEAPYSQLRLLAYALLRLAVQQQMSIEELHDSWLGTDPNQQRQLLQEAVLLLESTHPGVPRGVLRCLLSVLLEDRENLAGQWLAGVTYFNAEDLEFLGEAEPLGRDMHGTVIQLLGRLSSSAERPFVLVLDQLDLLSTVQQLDEIQRLLFALIDQSENWVVLIGLVGERFKFWEEHLSQALRGRIGVPNLADMESFKLPTIEITAIPTAEKQLLIKRRLESPSLQRQRALDQLGSGSYPFTEKDLDDLSCGGAVYPRHLLAACSERYSQICLEGETLAPVPLLEKVEALLDEAIDQCGAEADLMSPMELGERACDLIQLLAPPPVTVIPGGLLQEQRDFSGNDFHITSQASQLRLVSTDVTGKVLHALVQKLVVESDPTLLIRNAAAPLTARGETTGPLRAFREVKHFHQVTKAEGAVLLALGSVLAALREGNYEHLVTEPEASLENVQLALRSNERLRQLRFWLAAQEALTGKKREQKSAAATIDDEVSREVNTVAEVRVPVVQTVVREVGSATVAGNGAAKPKLSAPVLRADRATEPVPPPRTNAVPSQPEELSQQCIASTQSLLAVERWLELHHLQSRLKEQGHSCDLVQLRELLLSPVFVNKVNLCPAEQLHRDMTQIVIWKENLALA